MKTLILFNLKRRFFNKSTIIIFLLQFILIFCMFHLEIFDDEMVKEIYIDNSVKKYQTYFGQLKMSDLRYIISNGGRNEKVILHFNSRDKRWTIYNCDKADESILKQIKKDIVEVMKKEYADSHLFMRHYVEEYENIKVEIKELSRENANNEVLIILVSCCYFLLLGYGNLISSEIIYEKNMNVLPVILNNMDIKEHFYATIIYGYLVPLIRIGLTGICFGINILIGNSGNILHKIDEYVPELMQNEISFGSLVMVILIALSVLVIVQIGLLLVCSSFKNNNQAGNFLLILNVVGLLFYYVCLNNLTENILNNWFVVILSYFPIISMILMNGRILLSSCGIFSGIIALVFNLIFLYFLIEKSTSIYKRNLLR